jgi:hypothetical protein
VSDKDCDFIGVSDQWRGVMGQVIKENGAVFGWHGMRRGGAVQYVSCC